MRSCRKLLPCSPRRGRGVRNAELGLVVQSPPPPGADRLYSAGRVRGGILARERGQATTRATQVTRPPINPLRFKLVGQAGRRDIAPYAVSDPAILDHVEPVAGGRHGHDPIALRIPNESLDEQRLRGCTEPRTAWTLPGDRRSTRETHRMRCPSLHRLEKAKMRPSINRSLVHLVHCSAASQTKPPSPQQTADRFLAHEVAVGRPPNEGSLPLAAQDRGRTDQANRPATASRRGRKRPRPPCWLRLRKAIVKRTVWQYWAEEDSGVDPLFLLSPPAAGPGARGPAGCVASRHAPRPPNPRLYTDDPARAPTAARRHGCPATWSPAARTPHRQPTPLLPHPAPQQRRFPGCPRTRAARAGSGRTAR